MNKLEDFPFTTILECASSEQRLRFYESLSHNITVAVRAVWADEALSDSMKVDQMKWFNEIQHRVTSICRVIRLNTHKWTDDDMWQDIKHWAAHNPAVENGLLQAIKFSSSVMK